MSITQKPNNTVPTVESVTLTTPFGDISYQSNLKLSRASVVQLLYCYSHRLNNQKAEPGNKWQEYAYPELAKMFSRLLKDFSDAIETLIQEHDKDVVKINFCGYGNCKLPLMVQTRGVHYKTTYLYANVKHVLRTLEQRLSYLSTTPIPVRYQTEPLKQEAFLKVQELAKRFLDTSVKDAFVQWDEICKNARVVAGLPANDFKEDNDKGDYRNQRTGRNYGRNNNYQNDRRPNYQNRFDNQYNKDGGRNPRFGNREDRGNNFNGRSDRNNRFSGHSGRPDRFVKSGRPYDKTGRSGDRTEPPQNKSSSFLPSSSCKQVTSNGYHDSFKKGPTQQGKTYAQMAQ